VQGRPCTKRQIETYKDFSPADLRIAFPFSSVVAREELEAIEVVGALADKREGPLVVAEHGAGFKFEF